MVKKEKRAATIVDNGNLLNLLLSDRPFEHPRRLRQLSLQKENVVEEESVP